MSKTPPVLQLYREIRRLHRRLPPAMRFLGNTYARDEFRRHKDAPPEYVHGFTAEWETYRDKLMHDIPHIQPADAGASASAERGGVDPTLLERMSDAQLGQLYVLRQTAKGEQVNDALIVLILCFAFIVDILDRIPFVHVPLFSSPASFDTYLVRDKVQTPSSDSMDPAAEQPKKPCRVCSEFKTLQKSGFKSLAPPTVTKLECPPDREALGRATWTFLHTMAAYYPESPSHEHRQRTLQFLNSFSHLYPCNHCADHLRLEIKKTPPDVASRDGLSNWLCIMHNKVNDVLEKPQFDCKRVLERWRDGPPDGSCD
ncbi:hypothetical protein SeMB42_g00941 [Synchytrium endobioticum]|uniref:Sulfhydryl oxidase n=1 Tax=Synchytrium endobioticum TaxID=286115 RepID=A0A507DNB6_9FUNG|nr:hypothetical protein SeMB42_g00941 [Synchytrium endobioticum]